MKVLLILLALAIECYTSVESLNVTTTSTLESPEYESIKIVDQINPSTRPTIYNITTELTPNRNDSSDKLIILKKKPIVRLRKQKKISKNNVNTENTYKVHENGRENNDPKSKFTGTSQFLEKYRPRPNYSQSNYKKIKSPYEKSVTNNDFQTDESRVISSYRFPEKNAEIFNENPHTKINRDNAYQRERTNNHFENWKSNPELSYEESNPETSFQFESKPQDFTNNLRSDIVFEQFNEQRPSEEPSLPEINNVIQKLNTQNRANSYQSTKQNHIVEVNKVPLVFEHHYQGDYKSPQAKFVAHQYSYSTPADNSDEAYQLGKILSQNVVQKLQSAQKPLQEFIDDQQEVTLNIPLHTAYPQQSYVTTPGDKTTGSRFLHPLMKHLAPEISHNDFTTEIQNFHHPNTNAYQIIIPKTQMHPIVVEDEPIKPVYETTYLSAIQPFENNYHQSLNQQYRTNSPYSVNVQQEFMEVPKYTLMSFFNLQDRIKPEAIHEVDPPNLANFNNFKNTHIMRNPTPPSLSSLRTELLKNSEYLEKLPIEQHYQEDNHPSKWRSANEILNPQFVKYIEVDPTPVPNVASYSQPPRTQMIQSRPYWRKPQIMKLVRIPEQSQQGEREYQPHQQQTENIQEFDGSSNVAGDHQPPQNSVNQQYFAGNLQVTESNESPPVNQDLSHEHLESLIHAVSQHQPPQTEVRNQVTDSILLDQKAYNFNKELSSNEPKNIYFNQNPYKNDAMEKNPNHYVKTKKTKYSNDLNLNKQTNIRTEVELLKSVSPQYFHSPRYENVRQNAAYTRPITEDYEDSVELPRGYLNYHDHRSSFRAPTPNKVMNTRIIVPSERQKNREMGLNFRENRVYPYSRLRRLVGTVPGQNLKTRNISYLVFMREDEER